MSERVKSCAVGFVLFSVGSSLIYSFLYIPDPAGPTLFGWLMVFSPAVACMGLVILIRGIVWGERAFSGRSIFYSGLLMLGLGIYPWAYTPLIIRDRGMEGSGMLGTFLFLFLGLPGIVTTIIGWKLKTKLS